MRKILACLVPIAVIGVVAIVLFVTAPDKTVSDHYSTEFVATIVEISGDYVLVKPCPEADGKTHPELISFSRKNLEKLGVAAGDRVTITYTGEIMETYPAQINAISWDGFEK